MEFAPIALFVFNRLNHTTRTIAALKLNTLARESRLFIYCDGASNDSEFERVLRVRELVHATDGFRSVTVIERDHNLGLAASVISGVSQLCDAFGRVIVVEDDLVTSREFLRFMNQGLELYKDDERVASIHGYTYPIAGEDLPESYFLRGADCWGWATWARAWRHFEPDGTKLLRGLQEARLERRFNYDGYASYTRMLRNQTLQRNQSWAIRWHASAFLRDMVTLYPRENLVENVGFDDSGIHCGDIDYFTNPIGTAPERLTRVQIEESEMIRSSVVLFFRTMRRRRWINFLRNPITIGIRQARRIFNF